MDRGYSSSSGSSVVQVEWRQLPVTVSVKHVFAQIETSSSGNMRSSVGRRYSAGIFKVTHRRYRGRGRYCIQPVWVLRLGEDAINTEARLTAPRFAVFLLWQPAFVFSVVASL